MAPAILSVIAFSVLVIWRSVFARSHCLPARAISCQQRQHRHFLEHGLHISDPGSVVVIVDNRFENNSGGLDFFDRKDRAKR